MRNLFWGITLVVIGILLLLDRFGYASFSDMVHDYWPLILILWGGMILFRRREPENSGAPPPGGTMPQPPAGGATEPQAAPIGDLIHQSQVFGNIYSRVTSQSFKGGSVSTVFGDALIDLTDVVLAEGEHELRVHGVFGNTVVILPKGAAVWVVASALFGSLTVMGQHKGGISSDIQITTTSYAAAPARLKITLSRIFGDARVA